MPAMSDRQRRDALAKQGGDCTRRRLTVEEFREELERAGYVGQQALDCLGEVFVPPSGRGTTYWIVDGTKAFAASDSYAFSNASELDLDALRF